MRTRKTLGNRSTLQTTLEQHQDVVIRDVRKLLAPELRPGETMPDLGLLLRLFLRVLTRRFRRLEKSEQILIERRVRERRLRRLHAEAVKALYRQVSKLRSYLRGLFGQVAAIPLIQRGRTPQRPLALLRFSWDLREKLSQPDREIPPKTVPDDEKPDPARWVAELDDEAEELGRLHDDYVLAQKKTERAVMRKDARIGSFNDGLVTIGWIVVWLFRLSGHEKLARVIEPSRQDRGRMLAVTKGVRKAARTRKAKKAAQKQAPEARDSGSRTSESRSEKA